MTIQLMIAETRPVVRAGLISFLQGADIYLLGEAGTGDQLFQKAIQLQPDVILMDIWFPDETGFATVQRLRASNWTGKIIIFSSDDRITNLARAKAIGVDSWFSTRITRGELIRMLRLVAEGADVELSSGELRRVLGIMKKVRNEKLGVLTSREKQVLYHITLGLSNKEIAATLNLSRETIKEHVCNILRKLDVRDRTEAAVWAVKNNIII